VMEVTAPSVCFSASGDEILRQCTGRLTVTGRPMLCRAFSTASAEWRIANDTKHLPFQAEGSLNLPMEETQTRKLGK